MKNLEFLLLLAVIVIVTACKKNDTPDKFNVNTSKYEIQLNQDYNQANFYHNALIAKISQIALKSKSNNNITSDSIYNNRMYCINDSLFSQHFYLFCIDMMYNSDMMGSSSGMMGGSNGGMMGNGGTMNGGSMGNMQDMNSMIVYMNNLNSSVNLSTNPDYRRNDSLMHNQLTMCEMMTNRTIGVDNIYNNMQGLRKKHQLMK